MSKNIAVRYVRPKQIVTLDDIDFGNVKRGFYVCTSQTHPSNLQEGDLLYETDTRRLLFVDNTLAAQPLGHISVMNEIITLSATEINNKYFELSLDPIPASVTLTISGIVQTPNVDYGVSGRRVYWNSLELEPLLEVGDEIYCQYIPL